MEARANILIVDDDEINREMLQAMLEEDYSVYTAENGQEAIEMLKDGKRIYHIMLLDIVMPKVDGYGVLQYMQENNLLEDVPALVITGDESRQAMIKAYSLGAMDVFHKPFVSEVVKKRVQNTIRLNVNAYTDSVTGGMNRKAFIREVGSYLRNIDDPENYSILYFNIKNFKAINEFFGVEVGDQMLYRFHEGLEESSMKPIFKARLEADHFGVLVNNDNLILDEISEHMELKININGKKVHLYIRFGVYQIKKPLISVVSMLDKAKLAKQSIVDEASKPYMIFDDSLQNYYSDQAETLAEFELSIENNDFTVYYQPVIEAATGRLVSAEALVRWIHPEKGFISPGIFIPTLEKNGHISRLDRYVIRTVNEKIARREKENKCIVPVSVNLSWMDFYDSKMIDEIMKLLNEKSITSNRIRLEITETSYAALEQNRANLLDNLRLFGAVVLLDDFGTGYSSFGMLEDYSFDILKIDMSFVRKIELNEKSRIIIKGIIDICRNLGVKTIAEGAETKEQVDFLKESGCDYIQGYYYSKPLPEDEFIKFIDEYNDKGMIAR